MNRQTKKTRSKNELISIVIKWTRKVRFVIGRGYHQSGSVSDQTKGIVLESVPCLSRVMPQNQRKIFQEPAGTLRVATYVLTELSGQVSIEYAIRTGHFAG